MQEETHSRVKLTEKKHHYNLSYFSTMDSALDLSNTLHSEAAHISELQL